MEARASREYNRQSVRPVLQIIRVKMHGDKRVGLKVINVGLGPAVICEAVAELDGKPIGIWDRKAFDLLVESNKPLPGFSVLYEGRVIPAGGEENLIYLDPFRAGRHSWFWELVAYRVAVRIRYESLYGGEDFSTSVHPREPHSGNLI
jgi:hypothetical protein